MAAAISEGTLLWEPSEEMKQQANISNYMQWLESEKGLHFDDPERLWEWSVNSLEDFWASIWDYFHIKASQPYSAVLLERKMPGAQWFPCAVLNYAEHVFRHATSSRPAMLFQSEVQPLVEISWDELYHKVCTVAEALRAMGVQRGDRVVSYMPNIPESTIALLATASLGAIWSSCSPDLGSRSVIERLAQISPKVLLAVDGYPYGGKWFDRRQQVDDIVAEMPRLDTLIMVDYGALVGGAAGRGATGGDGAAAEGAAGEGAAGEGAAGESGGLAVRRLRWDSLPAGDPAADAATGPAEFGLAEFEEVPFGHPLWVLYSSGTTGLPKPIVHGHGGIVLEHLKAMALHQDLGPQDVFFWYTTTGWMMWKYLVG